MYKEPGSNMKNVSKIKREMKMQSNEESKQAKDFKIVDDYLKTLTKNFMKEPPSIETLDKAYNEMIERKKLEINEKNQNKKREEKAIFYDIFIKPKESKIAEIRNKRLLEKKLKEEINKKKLDLSDNLVAKASNNKKMKTFFTGRMKGFLNKLKGNKQKSNENLFAIGGSHMNLGLNFKGKNDSHILFNYLSHKFLPHHQGTNKANFFNQLIQIKPPEGINAIVASPLMESKGWAPSIPSMQITKTKTTLSDLMLRAKGGIQPGDIPKEAHMAFYLGVMNEEEKHYEEALKFYKKYFLSAKLLQDIYGTELALNRIGVLYSNILDYGK